MLEVGQSQNAFARHFGQSKSVIFILVARCQKKSEVTIMAGRGGLDRLMTDMIGNCKPSHWETGSLLLWNWGTTWGLQQESDCASRRFESEEWVWLGHTGAYETSGLIRLRVINTTIGVALCFPTNRGFVCVSRMGESVVVDVVGRGTVR